MTFKHTANATVESLRFVTAKGVKRAKNPEAHQSRSQRAIQIGQYPKRKKLGGNEENST
jgi:hypothetical protein